ncbi:hypothetical protein CKCE_0443 [Candidatus Kinetoplastibacterium crithidii (ex Angomonas deanei ATCC 30255)]|nr:hypothetical protein CKCE_0443 [Candidatus Kinetoplastibacterium crithidii (ex Angomonas deanei ATCC 30255)]
MLPVYAASKNSDLQLQIENIKKSNLVLLNRLNTLEHELAIILNQVEIIKNNHVENNNYKNSNVIMSEKISEDILEEEFKIALDLLKKEKYSEAEEKFNKILEINYDIKLINEIKFYSGICKYKLGKFKESIAQLQNYIKNNSTNRIPEALITIADNKIALNDISGATEILRTITKQYKNSEVSLKAEKKLKMIN